MVAIHCNILLITKKLQANPIGGRELLCKCNHDALCSIFGKNLFLFEISTGKLNSVGAYIDAFRGHIDGVNDVSLEAVLSLIKTKNIQKVFVDGSNLGEFVRILKQRLANIEVITFFHNVESWFFWGSFCLVKSPRALGVFLVNYLAERKAVRWSDKIVCLSERDSRLLKKVYGRGATHTSSMALEDKLLQPYAHNIPPNEPRFALFVGGTFYANLAGITWFVREVVPRIDMPIVIIGRGFESVRSELEVSGKVTVIGGVRSLAEWYQQAHFVIAPIFEGSGMKTKVAEALMYGKKIIGTPEAFSGYHDIADQAGWVCSSADEFVTAVTTAQKEVDTLFYANLREIYLHRYSLEAARSRLIEILNDPV